MEVANTNVNMTDSGSSTSVDTSSSINNSSNTSSPSTQSSQTNTSSYQTNISGNTYEVEEIDLSMGDTDTGAQVQSSENKSLLSKVGDWFSDVGKAIYDTGAKVVSGTVSFVVDGLKGIGKSIAETAANVASNVSAFMGAIGEAFKGGPKALLATGAVIATSIKSGFLKLEEHIYDSVAWAGGKLVRGATWLAGKAVGLFSEDAGNKIIEGGKSIDKAAKEFVARDLVGELNQWFYESTPVGRWINENSTIKYDSDLALGLRKVTERAAEIVAAAAITAATGGAGAFAVGAMYGIGKSAEQSYQKNGTDSTVLQELGILGSGALTGLSWMVTGKLVNGFVEIGKTATTKGIGNVLSGLSKDILTKDFWLKAFKTGLTGANGLGNVAASAMMTGEELMPYINGTKEWSVEGVTKLAWHFALCLGLNVAEDALRGYVTDFDPNKLGHYNDATDVVKKVVKELPPQTEFKTDEDAVAFAQKYLSKEALSDVANEEEYVKSALDQLRKFMGDEISSDPTRAYYTLMNLRYAEMDPTLTTKFVTEIVNSNSEFRKTVLSLAKSEAIASMGPAMGITDESVINELVDCLLGKDFVDGGLGQGKDWDRVKEIILPYVKEQVKNNPDGATLWTKVSNFAVDEKFSASVENVTTGSEAYFFETLLCNWNGDIDGAPKCEELWGVLSEVYAEACSGMVDSAGNPVKQLKLLVPKISTDASDYGALFANSELPTLLKLGTIDSIDVTQVAGFEDLTEVGHKIVDLTGIRKTYQDLVSKGTSKEVISTIIFGEFLKQLGGA